MKKIYWNYSFLIIGIILLIVTNELKPDGILGFIMILSSLLFFALAFLWGNNPGKVMIEFFKSLL
ncbi:hypothetical protein J2T56_000189 [Natronobacillus azotifigens]|uniref:Uncharacterized protein n=1 Tax=Natronobacillus azotifigens TaxID=472978 RepID=A0A9J6R7K9_9BACI|nr:hypothetical protein [Natronobacillus azotifigens]MCZ0701605.1 hypothetical protein [Natronobacillus azotifigens]